MADTTRAFNRGHVMGARAVISQSVERLYHLELDHPEALLMARRIAGNAAILERGVLERQSTPSPSED